MLLMLRNQVKKTGVTPPIGLRANTGPLLYSIDPKMLAIYASCVLPDSLPETTQGGGYFLTPSNEDTPQLP